MGQLHYFIPDAPMIERIARLKEIRDEIDAFIEDSQRIMEQTNQPELFEDNSNSTT
jgi:hypothetical protein|tara:strand:- start:329 stop:496 length:168 start_codon:yes stop_codon:yes gene_type:complete